jgi:hypothetical protein
MKDSYTVSVHCAGMPRRTLSCKESSDIAAGCRWLEVSNLLVYIELPEDFRCIKEVLVLKNSAVVSTC